MITVTLPCSSVSVIAILNNELHNTEARKSIHLRADILSTCFDNFSADVTILSETKIAHRIIIAIPEGNKGLASKWPWSNPYSRSPEAITLGSSLIARGMPRLLLSSASFKKRRGLRLELLRLPKFDLSPSSPAVSRPLKFDFSIWYSRIAPDLRAFASASTPPAGGLSPKVASKSPRSKKLIPELRTKA